MASMPRLYKPKRAMLPCNLLPITWCERNSELAVWVSDQPRFWFDTGLQTGRKNLNSLGDTRLRWRQCAGKVRTRCRNRAPRRFTIFIRCSTTRRLAALVKRRIDRAISHMNISDLTVSWTWELAPAFRSTFTLKTSAKSSALICPAACSAKHAKKSASRAVTTPSSFKPTPCGFPLRDNTFDHVFISHVISVVSDPYQLVARSAAGCQGGRPHCDR